MKIRRPLASIEQAAEYYGVPIATFYAWRYRGTGPKSAKIGRHIRYRWEDLESYFDAQASTARTAV